MLYCEATILRNEESPHLMHSDILLVDDNAIQAATRKAILTRTGRNVVVASSGEQALQMLQEASTASRLRLVITDHLMPGMNGPEFVAALRKSHAKLPVIVLSGLAEAEEEYEGLDVIFRMKPLPPDELLSLVRSLLGQPITKSA